MARWSVGWAGRYPPRMEEPFVELFKQMLQLIQVRMRFLFFNILAMPANAWKRKGCSAKPGLIDSVGKGASKEWPTLDFPFSYAVLLILWCN